MAMQQDINVHTLQDILVLVDTHEYMTAGHMYGTPRGPLLILDA